MPKPYSYDLPQKVIQAIELDRMSKTQAAQVFQISRNTINLWLQRKASTGDYQALLNQPPGNGHKITDWEKFQKFVEVNRDKTQAQMAKLWPEEISERTISRALKKIGLRRKKKLTAIKKEIKLNDKNLEKRLTTINQSQSSI
ncbi:MAG: IS630 transposase-related protein [Nostoc sp.]|uniref:helix-turn-helix domain-containing protein n=1 Tax=Nostoc sp. TaxID=1180 RepID=UPI002FF4A644